MTVDSYGLDLHAEVLRLREQNSKLTKGMLLSGVAAFIGIVFGISAFAIKPQPERFAVDPAGRVFPVAPLTTDDPPDARVTRFAGDCINGLLNHAFHNYQNTVERAVSECFTGGGTESVKQTIMPLLQTMKDKQLNLATEFVILPFINNRVIENNRRVYKVQGVIAVGYRGKGASIRPIQYAFQTDVVRVPYDSSIEGIRLQNLILEIRNN